MSAYRFQGGAFVCDFFLFTFGRFDVRFCFLLDCYSFTFLFLVSSISSIVFFYRLFYMGRGRRRFCYLVFFFVLSMWLLIVSGNFLTLVAGWDGLGMTSYLLVIYYDRRGRFNSGVLTFLSNRVGDAFFVFSFGLFIVGSFYFCDVFSYFFMEGLALVLLVGAITKRAQVPFRAWLPAAMAAPTPVSSLVHSSTLVTRGVYVCFRFGDLFFN
jgi:NADH-ubiquinone oxidoreductase chain 5